MAKTKGTDVAALRHLLEEAGPDKLKAFFERLDAEARECFHRITPSSWTPVEEQLAFYEHAAAVLFPGHPEPLRQLGRAMAEKTFRGIYKIFLRLPTVTFIMSRAAQVWRSYYDQGEAEVEQTGEGEGIFRVRGFPGLPRRMREVICGHMSVLLEATGAKNVRMQIEDGDPNAWRWVIRWE